MGNDQRVDERQGLLFQYIELAVTAGLTWREHRDIGRRAFVIQHLRHSGFNQCKAARAMGMHRNTLSRAIEDLKIDVPREREKWLVENVKKLAGSARPPLLKNQSA